MHALVPVVRLVEGPPVALGLHKQGLSLPLLVEVGHPLCDVVVVQHVPEVVQGQILNLCVVAIRNADHLWSTKMLILAQMRR